MITADAFVAIEESLIKYVMGLIWPDVSPIFLKVDRALEAGNLDLARQELGTISLSALEEQAIGYVTYMTTVGMLFGASRVAQLPATSVVGMGFESDTVSRMAKSFCQSITHKLEAYLKQIGEEKIHSVQKEELVEKANPYHDEAGRFTQAGSATHTSAWGRKARNGKDAPKDDQLRERYADAAKEVGLPPTYSGKDSSWLDEVVDNPVKVTSYMSFKQAKGLDVSTFSDGKDKEFELSDLKAVQDYVNPEKVQDYLKKIKSGNGDFKLNVAKVGKDLVVVDGTHRLVALHLSGAKKVTVNYLGDLKVKKAEPVLLPFASFMDDAGRAYLNIVSSLHTSRVSAYGFTAEAFALGIKDYQLSEQLDGRTCPVCRALHGKKFPVGEARQTLDIVTRVTDPDDLKSLQPWPGQTKADVVKLRAMSNDDLIQANWHIPPFHPRCRGMLVRSGKAPTLAQLDAGYVDTRYEATKEDFKAMRVYLNEAQIKYWNEHVGMAPAEMVARLTGRPLDEFLAGLMDAGKPKEFAGIYSVTVNKNITVKLAKEGFGSANKFDQSVKILPQSKSLYLESVDLHEEDQAGGIAKKYMREFYALAKDMGLKKLELYAGLDVGGYAWAKYGFVPDLKSWEALKRDIAARYKAVDYGTTLSAVEQKAYAVIMASEDPKNIFLLADIGFGKDLLLGQGWQGVLDLADTESVTRFLSYIGEL